MSSASVSSSSSSRVPASALSSQIGIALDGAALSCAAKLHGDTREKLSCSNGSGEGGGGGMGRVGDLLTQRHAPPRPPRQPALPPPPPPPSSTPTTTSSASASLSSSSRVPATALSSRIGIALDRAALPCAAKLRGGTRDTGIACARARARSCA
ncbi:CASP-like protein 4A2 [Ananas comosus]|uniref:CASP-like protein 4A2 n=1 Tax=Ananas comosus TaxID=4615 RepID=A0A6P5FUB4_ANACO|nr:CASP-like protein 4A2 [Ananas comosus]